MTSAIADKWLKQALHDLEMAKKNVDIGGYDIAAFLAQQSVEKLFKALFAYAGKKIPRSHYIDELATELHVPDEIMNDIIDLSADYMFARYPDVAEHLPYEEYTLEIAREKVEKAESIFHALKERY